MRPTKRLPDQDIVLEVRSLHKPGSLGKLLSVIGNEGGLIGDLVTKSVGKTTSIREITVSVFDSTHQQSIINAIEEKTHATILSITDPVFERHKGGKIHSVRKHDVKTVADLRYVYTPGVARVCTAIREQPSKAREYTNIHNSIGMFTTRTVLQRVKKGLGEEVLQMFFATPPKGVKERKTRRCASGFPPECNS